MKVAALIICILASAYAQADVWPTTRHWDQNAEAEFGQWIQNLPLEIFQGYKIPTDCAEAAYTLRSLFAWENGLPVRFQNRDDLDNNSAQFDSLADTQPESGRPYNTALSPRVRAFINYVRLHTNTQTLVNDSYPLAINRQTIRTGVMFLHDGERSDVPKEFRYGHVYYLKSINYVNGIITYVSSTVPADVRTLSTYQGIDFAPWNTASGYRTWIWPDSNERPGFSQEQFHLAGWHANGFRDAALWDRWQTAVLSRLRSRQPTAAESMAAREMNLRSSIAERALVVQKGWRLYQSHYLSRGLKCMNEGDYDNYSTPTRDSKIQVEMQLFEEAAQNYLSSQTRYGFSGPESALNQLLASKVVTVGSGLQVSFAQIADKFLSNCQFLPLSEPEHSPAVRWGLQPLEQSQWPCPERLKQYSAALQACGG